MSGDRRLELDSEVMVKRMEQDEMHEESGGPGSASRPNPGRFVHEVALGWPRLG